MGGPTHRAPRGLARRLLLLALALLVALALAGVAEAKESKEKARERKETRGNAPTTVAPTAPPASTGTTAAAVPSPAARAAAQHAAPPPASAPRENARIVETLALTPLALPNAPAATPARAMPRGATVEEPLGPGLAPTARAPAARAALASAPAPAPASEPLPSVAKAPPLPTARAATPEATSPARGVRRLFAFILAILGWRRVDAKNALEHVVRERVLKLVRESPGRHTRAIARELSLTAQNAAYHLRRLETLGLAAATSVAGKRAWHACDGGRGAREASRVTAAMAGDARARVMAAIAAAPGAHGLALAEATGLRSGSVSWLAKQLVKAGLVEARRDGRRVLYAPAAGAALPIAHGVAISAAP